MNDAAAADRIAEKIRLELRIRELMTAHGISRIVKGNAFLQNIMERRGNRATRRAVQKDRT